MSIIKLYYQSVISWQHLFLALFCLRSWGTLSQRRWRRQFPNENHNFGSLWLLQHWVPDGVCGIRHENDLWRASETRFPRDLNVIVHTPSSSSPFYLGTRKPSKNHLLWLSVPQERKQNNAKNKCCQETTD